MIGIEYYDIGLPEGVGYDGISEWRCEKCKIRIGRWSGKELKAGEWERRYGGEPVKCNTDVK